MWRRCLRGALEVPRMIVAGVALVGALGALGLMVGAMWLLDHRKEDE